MHRNLEVNFCRFLLQVSSLRQAEIMARIYLLQLIVERNRVQLGYWGKRFMIVNSIHPSVSFCNQPQLLMSCVSSESVTRRKNCKHKRCYKSAKSRPSSFHMGEYDVDEDLIAQIKVLPQVGSY